MRQQIKKETCVRLATSGRSLAAIHNLTQTMAGPLFPLFLFKINKFGFVWGWVYNTSIF